MHVNRTSHSFDVDYLAASLHIAPFGQVGDISKPAPSGSAARA